MLAVSGVTVYSAAVSFRQPRARVVINDRYAGIHFVVELGRRHVPARAAFESLGASVSWCPDTFLTIEFNGQIHSPDFLLRDNRSYVDYSLVGLITGRYVEFIEEVNAITINSRERQTDSSSLVRLLPGFNGYTEEDLKWLSRIIHAEARGEPYEAMLAVGNVVLNRRASDMYPDTIRDVIFDRRNGVQFTPTVNGTINNTPSAASFLAAVEVLEGRQNAEGVLFFKNPRLAGSTWMSRNRPFAFTLNNHDFFY